MSRAPLPDRPHPIWREIWWQVTVFFWVLGLLLRSACRRYVDCWGVERARRLPLVCVRCGRANLARCRAPGWSGYRCAYEGSQLPMPATCCPHRRPRDGAWCRLPAGDGHAQHEFEQIARG
jgi:hypothetical protein